MKKEEKKERRLKLDYDHYKDFCLVCTTAIVACTIGISQTNIYPVQVSLFIFMSVAGFYAIRFAKKATKARKDLHDLYK